MNIKNIPDFSMVKYDGELWIKGRSRNNRLLIKLNEKGDQVGREVKTDTDVELLKYPAQMAFEALERETKEATT